MSEGVVNLDTILADIAVNQQMLLATLRSHANLIDQLNTRLLNLENRLYAKDHGDPEPPRDH